MFLSEYLKTILSQLISLVAILPSLIKSQQFPNYGYGGGGGGAGAFGVPMSQSLAYPYARSNPSNAYETPQIPAQAASADGSKPTIAGRDLECNYDRNTGPMCKRSKLSPFMCHHNDNYPSDGANYIIENYGTTFKGLTITEVDVWDVYDGPIGEDKDSICETDIELVRPGYAKTVKDQWRAVMQGPDVTQTVRVERCLRPNTPCRHVPGCYETNCKQRYSYVRLLVFDPCNKFSGPSYEMFRVPTACDCQMSPSKKASGGGAFGVPGIPDFISNNPDIANSMKNVDGQGFSGIPSSSGASLSGKKR